MPPTECAVPVYLEQSADDDTGHVDSLSRPGTPDYFHDGNLPVNTSVSNGFFDRFVYFIFHLKRV